MHMTIGSNASTRHEEDELAESLRRPLCMKNIVYSEKAVSFGDSEDEGGGRRKGVTRAKRGVPKQGRAAGRGQSDCMWPPHFHPHNCEWRVRYRFRQNMRIKTFSCKLYGAAGAKTIALFFVQRWVGSGRRLAEKTKRSKLSVGDVTPEPRTKHCPLNVDVRKTRRSTYKREAAEEEPRAKVRRAPAKRAAPKRGRETGFPGLPDLEYTHNILNNTNQLLNLMQCQDSRSGNLPIGLGGLGLGQANLASGGDLLTPNNMRTNMASLTPQTPLPLDANADIIQNLMGEEALRTNNLPNIDSNNHSIANLLDLEKRGLLRALASASAGIHCLRPRGSLYDKDVINNVRGVLGTGLKAKSHSGVILDPMYKADDSTAHNSHSNTRRNSKDMG